VRAGFETFDFAFIENVLEHLLLAALASERQPPDRARIGGDPLEIEQSPMTADWAGDAEQQARFDQGLRSVFVLSIAHGKARRPYGVSPAPD
jgi:hypothetical protein